MSIYIDMEFYCDGCQEMDPEVENTDYCYYGDMKKVGRESAIVCKNRYMCQNIYQHIVKKIKDKEKEK